MKRLPALTAALEGATGIALLLVPTVLTRLLFGVPLTDPVALTVAGVGGTALLAIGVACWLARRDDARSLVVGMLFYNAAAVGILVHAAIRFDLHDIGLWPTVVLHTALAS